MDASGGRDENLRIVCLKATQMGDLRLSAASKYDYADC
jgi:hypothetical protein